MGRRPTLRLGVLVLPVLVLVELAAQGCGTYGAGAATLPAVLPADPDTLVGTVRSVNYNTQTVEVLIGFGAAVSVEPVRVEPTVPVTIGGERRPLAELRRGQVIRVVYRETAAGKVAASLEVVR